MRSHFTRIAALFLASAALLAPTADTASAQTKAAPAAKPAPAAPKKVTSVEGITEYALDNGLRVLLFPDPSKATVTVNLTVLVGSRHEGYGETGMAHLLEHMTFKGSPKHPDTWKELEEHGAQFNGSTWFDRTNYFETLPATDANLEFALDLEADRLQNSTIAADKLATEFSVVRNEFEMGENDPPSILSERMWSTAYLWHNYGKSTIGSRSDIERVPIDALRAFYKKYYQPDNAILVIAGKFDEAKALGLVQKYYAPIAKPTRKLQPTYTVEPVQDGERVVTLERNGDVAVVGIMYHTVAGTDADWVATEAVGHVLTNEPSGRLYTALVKTGLATRVWDFNFPLAEAGAQQFFAEVKVDKDEAKTLKKVQQVRDKMISIVEGFGASKIDDKEVERYKTKTLKDFKLNMTRADRIAVELSEWAAQGDWRLIFVYRDRVEQVTKEAVAKVAGTYFKESNRTVGVFVPDKNADRSPMPPQPDVIALVKDYKGRPPVAQGEQFVATTANIEKRTTRGALSNGMKYALLSKETRGDAVQVVMSVRFGTEKDLTGNVLAASTVPDMLMRGSAKHAYQALKDEFDRLQAQVSFGGGNDPGVALVNIKTTRDNLAAVLALVAEVLRTPVFPKEEFEILKKEEISSLEAQLQDPNTQGFLTLIRAVNPVGPNDVRYVASTQESIDRWKALKLEDVKKIYKLWGASYATVALVGDFDAGEAKEVLEQQFGTWKSAKPYKRIESKYTATKGADTKVDTPDKEMAIILLGHQVEIRDDDDEYPAFDMLNYLFGGSVAGRLFGRLRQKEGLSYGAFSFVQADSVDRYGIFVSGGILAPQNAAKGMTAMLEELDKIIKEPVGTQELADSKKSYQGEFDNRLTSDSYIAGRLNTGLEINRTFEFEQKQLDKVLKLTPQDIQKVAKKYFMPGTAVKITAGDMKKAAGANQPK
jgi:zinc protease